MRINQLNKLIKVILICLIIQPSFIGIAFCQTKAEKIDELMSKYEEYGRFNGSVLVAENGKVIFKKGYGLANMEWNIPNTPDTKHRLGSITKQFTAYLILQLVAEGKLDLYTPITKYLPDYPKKNGDIITIHQLLTHTSGIPNFTSFPSYEKTLSKNPCIPKDFVSVFADSALKFKPGEKFSYSNSGYFLLGVILEKVTGKSYEQLLKERIFNPLKMNNTGVDNHENIIKNRASGYSKDLNTYTNASYIDMSVPFSAGDLYSTVEDLYIWDQALYDENFLPAKTRNLMFNKYINVGDLYYGYGWFVGKLATNAKGDSIQIITHNGGINGFNTLIQRFPEKKQLIVILNNTGTTILGEMSASILSILLGIEYNSPKKSTALSLLDVIVTKGLGAGLDFFNTIKSSKEYSLNEYEMNSVGYSLLNSGKVKEAIEVFKLNVVEFPKAFNTYDSLGEAYLADGNEKLAIENYKKSLELNPDNTNAKNVLLKLGIP